MKIQLVIVAVLVGAALADRGDDREGGRKALLSVVPNWVQMRGNVNISIILDSTVYSTSIAPVFVQLQPFLPQAGLQVTDVAGGKQIDLANVFAGDVVRFLRNAQNDTNSPVVIVDPATAAAIPGTRTASEFTLQVNAPQQQTLAAKMGNSNLKQLFRDISNELVKRIGDVARGILSPLQNIP